MHLSAYLVTSQESTYFKYERYFSVPSVGITLKRTILEIQIDKYACLLAFREKSVWAEVINGQN